MDLTSYQSEDTVWRYYSQLSRASDAVEDAEKALNKAQRELERLKAHPPLFHLFNWSA